LRAPNHPSSEMSDISLLPEELRGKEEEVRGGTKPLEKKPQEGALAMHVPEAAPDEDIEIIEVDEGDLAAVLSDEPFMTRFTYQLSAAIDKLKDRLFKKEEALPPAKLPPQFFKPPKPGLVTKAPAPGAKPGAASGPQPGMPKGKPRARIVPQEVTPRRVRVIRRVKKPVRVSLITAEELASLSIDIGRRRWTFAVTAVLFAVLIGAGYYLLNRQTDESRARLADVRGQLEETRATSAERQETWSRYEDLEDRLTMLDEVLNEHVVISRMFDFLELRTLPSVAYRTAAWSSDGEFVLDVITDSYETAARQIVSFEQSDSVLSVDATSFTAAQSDGEEEGATEITEVSFQLILELDMAALRGPLLADVSEAGSVEDEGAMEMEPSPDAN
jgi:Tfp pilus assembly protein PilN